MLSRVGRLVLVCAPLAALACGPGTPIAPVEPVIQFTTVPPAAPGGSERTARIAGRVTGAAAGQRIVLYARAGQWWVQPLTADPFTPVRRDSTWESATHLGTEYAALLVEADFRPPDTTGTLPVVGRSVRAVATVKGTGDYTPSPAPPGTVAPGSKTLTFSGYEWQVREIPSDRGGQNDYDPANAWVDAEGFLHLRLARRGDRWTSAEVILARALGYGTYAFTVRDTSALDPAAAFGMFTWDEQATDPNHREMAIEISQWGDREIPNAQYVVQPFYVPANVARFAAPRGTLTHAFRWEPGRVSFHTARGRAAMAGAAVPQHAFTSGVPAPGGEHVRLNLYYFRHARQEPRQDVEVVVERFQYLP